MHRIERWAAIRAIPFCRMGGFNQCDTTFCIECIIAPIMECCHKIRRTHVRFSPAPTPLVIPSSKTIRYLVGRGSLDLLVSSFYQISDFQMTVLNRKYVGHLQHPRTGACRLFRSSPTNSSLMLRVFRPGRWAGFHTFSVFLRISIKCVWYRLILFSHVHNQAKDGVSSNKHECYRICAWERLRRSN